jgi:hypothetical protein
MVDKNDGTYTLQVLHKEGKSWRDAVGCARDGNTRVARTPRAGEGKNNSWRGAKETA